MIHQHPLRGAAACLLLALAAPLPALAQAAPTGAAQTAPTQPAAPPAAAPNDLDLRLQFLEERLDAGRTTAQVWQYGWTGVFAVSAISNTVQLFTADNGDDRVVAAVDGTKSLLATTKMLLKPLPATRGADPMRAEPGRTPEQRLALGESQLMLNAQYAEERWSFSTHLQPILVNALGGGIIYAFGDSRDAAISAATGILVSEAQIWSQPWRASQDLRDYKSRFPQTITWEIRPRLNGAELAFHF
ncbi:MAG: hypothetical protein U1E17_07420 [Geminicoccaceae bacterium]